jgi:hypothetical protein
VYPLAEMLVMDVAVASSNKSPCFFFHQSGMPSPLVLTESFPGRIHYGLHDPTSQEKSCSYQLLVAHCSPKEYQ